MSAITAACPASVGAVRQGETGAKNEPMNSSAAAMPVCTLLCYLCPSLSCDKRNLHGKLNNFLVSSFHHSSIGELLILKEFSSEASSCQEHA